eukprot:583424-Pelagomonas_calceolata.AAC.1
MAWQLNLDAQDLAFCPANPKFKRGAATSKAMTQGLFCQALYTPSFQIPFWEGRAVWLGPLNAPEAKCVPKPGLLRKSPYWLVNPAPTTLANILIQLKITSVVSGRQWVLAATKQRFLLMSV